MQKKTKNKIFTIFICGVSAILGIAIILFNLEKNITFFVTPTQLSHMHLSKEFRLGGLIKQGSVEKIDLKTIRFLLADQQAEIEVYYQGILPALFRENQGIVATGVMQDKIFVANELLVKHDENYRPPGINY